MHESDQYRVGPDQWVPWAQISGPVSGDALPENLVATEAMDVYCLKPGAKMEIPEENHP